MFKLRTLTAAVTLAAAGFVAAPAQAVIDDANMPSLGGNAVTFLNTGGFAGEIFLSVVARDASNPLNNQSYVRDLGITTDGFVNDIAGQVGISIEANTTLTSFLSDNAGKDINFALTGVNSPDLLDVVAFQALDQGFTASVRPGVDVAANQPQTNAQWNGAGQDFDFYLGAVNLALSGVPTAGNPALTPAQIAINDSGTFEVGDPGFHDAPNWGSSPFGFNAEGDIGSTVEFYFLGLENTNNSISRDPVFLGEWTLDNAGTLSFQPVPVPAAVWMFGSALLGMAGAKRRSRAQA